MGNGVTKATSFLRKYDITFLCPASLGGFYMEVMGLEPMTSRV